MERASGRTLALALALTLTLTRRSLRTIICSTDASMHEIEPGKLSSAGIEPPKTVALPIGQSTGKVNWRKLRSAWQMSSVQGLGHQGASHK